MFGRTAPMSSLTTRASLHPTNLLNFFRIITITEAEDTFLLLALQGSLPPVGSAPYLEEDLP